MLISEQVDMVSSAHKEAKQEHRPTSYYCSVVVVVKVRMVTVVAALAIVAIEGPDSAVLET